MKFPTLTEDDYNVLANLYQQHPVEFFQNRTSFLVRSMKDYVYDARVFRISIMGETRCLPKDTLIKTPRGKEKIQDVTKVLSYNFETKKTEDKNCHVHNSGKKKEVIITTTEGILRCTSEHAWIIKRGDEILTVTTDKLLLSDKLLKFRRTKKQMGALNSMWKNMDETKIRDMYIEQGQSMKTIANTIGVSRTGIRKRLKKMGIKTRSFSEQYNSDKSFGRPYPHPILFGEDNPSYKDGRDAGQKANRKIYLEMVKNKEWVCDECKAIETNDNFDLVVHHLNENNKDNRLENLRVLCQSCHSKIHYKNSRLRNAQCSEK